MYGEIEVNLHAFLKIRNRYIDILETLKNLEEIQLINEVW